MIPYRMAQAAWTVFPLRPFAHGLPGCILELMCGMEGSR